MYFIVYNHHITFTWYSTGLRLSCHVVCKKLFHKRLPILLYRIPLRALKPFFWTVSIMQVHILHLKESVRNFDLYEFIRLLESNWAATFNHSSISQVLSYNLMQSMIYLCCRWLAALNMFTIRTSYTGTSNLITFWWVLEDIVIR